jgi:hypothetical protein
MNLHENLPDLKVPFHEGFMAKNLRGKLAETADVAQKPQRLAPKYESSGWIRTTLKYK